MPHTKRSEAFALEISNVIANLATMPLPAGMSDSDRGRLIEILEKNTTDSPCVVKAAEDEPIFTLRGQDAAAGATVRHWARLTESLHVDLHREPPMAKLIDAKNCADMMDRWPGRRMAD